MIEANEWRASDRDDGARAREEGVRVRPGARGVGSVEAHPRAWVGVAASDHVARGVAGGFAPLCHGRRAPLARMGEGDWLVYYSPRVAFGGDEALRAFTAIGRVGGGTAYAFDMGGGFVPYRRDIRFVRAKAVPLARLASSLRFVGERDWGLKARRGHFAIELADLRIIAAAMGVAAVG